jgi:hypothetical protein
MRQKAAVDRAGSQVKFIDYSTYVELFEGGFCSDGSNEDPDSGEERQGNLHSY